MRKLFCLAAALFLSLTLCVGAEAAFKDVPEGHWAYDTLQRAAEYRLVGGDGDGYFGVGQTVTRAQFSKMLCRLMGWELITPETGSFRDNQNQDVWFYPYIETANAHGVLLVLDDTCVPDEPLPREEMTAMIVRALDLSTLAGIVQDDCPYSDVTTNRGYVALAYQMGIVNGVGGGRFDPQTPAKREQAATVLVRVYERLYGFLSAQTVVYSGGSTVPAKAVWAKSLDSREGTIPMHPLAPLENVYEAAIQAGKGGVVALHTAPWELSLSEKNAAGKTVTEADVEQYLADKGTQSYRSARYESSYLINTARSRRTLVWYESKEDLAVKTRLCRLLGISAVYLAD